MAPRKTTSRKRPTGAETPRKGVPDEVRELQMALAESEERRRQITAAFSESNRRKDEFLATLAHELRNPLAPLRNGLQIMQMAGQDNPVLVQAREMMKRQLQEMVRIIDDLLEMGRLTLGRTELHRERVEIAAVVRRAEELARPVLEEAEMDLRVQVTDEPLLVNVDPRRVAHLFCTLLTGGLENAKAGRASLVVERSGADVVIRIRRSDSASQPPEGLSLSHQLVSLHGGSIATLSRPHGQGSEVVIQLPLAGRDSPSPVSTAVATTGETAIAARRRRILVADDNADAADTLAALLRLSGHEVRTAADGAEAWDMADWYRPDTAVLDIGMPKLSGYDLCRRIRGEEWGKSMLIVALTGWGQPSHQQESADAGFDQHLVKPVEPGELLRLLETPPEVTTPG